jgi:hypothetical protein
MMDTHRIIMAHLGLPLGLWSEKVAVARVRSFYHKPGLLQREEVLGGGALGGGEGGVNLSPLGGRFGSWIFVRPKRLHRILAGDGLADYEWLCSCQRTFRNHVIYAC